MVEQRLLADFSVASQPGNERLAARQVAQAVGPLDLTPERLQRLETAVSEATLNAIEHGNHFEADKSVGVRVVASATELVVSVTDQGGAGLVEPPEAPDIEAKLANRQTPRGWGMFLIVNMVDEVTQDVHGCTHCVNLRLRLNDR
jgi:anti-sigma regulatory factor (Ser/Thr protein kinase)